MKKTLAIISALAILALAGCGGGSGPKGAQTGAGGSSAREAPEFVKLVAEGKLPPLNERLPKNPLVVTPYERVGVYGGTWRLAMVGGNHSHYNRYQG